MRELENTIHRAVLLADGAEIGIEAIELGPPAAMAQVPVGGGIASLVGRRMEEVERDLIIETLGHTLGNRPTQRPSLAYRFEHCATSCAIMRREVSWCPGPPQAWRREEVVRSRVRSAPRFLLREGLGGRGRRCHG